jgi:hypothetical protein
VEMALPCSSKPKELYSSLAVPQIMGVIDRGNEGCVESVVRETQTLRPINFPVARAA